VLIGLGGLTNGKYKAFGSSLRPTDLSSFISLSIRGKMAISPQVLRSFLADSIRLSGRALECLRELEEQSKRKQVSPPMVRSLYQVIHTLKGTAAMVEGAGPIAQSLHEIEGRLTCQSVVDSAANPHWLPLARQSLNLANTLLTEMSRR